MKNISYKSYKDYKKTFVVVSYEGNGVTEDPFRNYTPIKDFSWYIVAKLYKRYLTPLYENNISFKTIRFKIDVNTSNVRGQKIVERYKTNLRKQIAAIIPAKLCL